MSKLFVTAMFVAVTTLVAASSAAAGGTIGGIYVGAAIPSSPSGFNDAYGAGGALSVFLAGPIRGPVGWCVEVGNDRMLPGQDDLDLNFDVVRLHGGLMLADWESESSTRPYGYVTVGGYHQSRYTNPLPLVFNTVGDDQTDLGIGFGGGVDFLIGDRWGLGGNVTMHGIMHGDNIDSTWYLQTGVRVFFKLQERSGGMTSRWKLGFRSRCPPGCVFPVWHPDGARLPS